MVCACGAPLHTLVCSVIDEPTAVPPTQYISECAWPYVCQPSFLGGDCDQTQGGGVMYMSPAHCHWLTLPINTFPQVTFLNHFKRSSLET